MRFQPLNKIKNRIYFVAALCLSLFLAKDVQAQKKIALHNPTTASREELISIPYKKFSQAFGLDSNFQIKDDKGNFYPHQLERLGESKVQNVLILVNIPAKGNLELQPDFSESTQYPAMTYARKVPERFDDFAWENNVVAFRIYGPALEGRADDAQGIDFWAKRIPNLIINKWYKSKDYHQDHGEGLDYYSVGKSLGLGDVAIYLQDSLIYGKHYRTHKILDNGPLRTTFELTYPEENYQGQRIQLKKTISLDANSRFNRIQIEVDNKDKSSSAIVIGLVKRKEKEPIYQLGANNNYLAYWEPNINKNGHTATAIVYPNKIKSNFINSPIQFLKRIVVSNKTPITYYSGAAWDKEGKITDSNTWFEYVKQFASSRKEAIRVKIK
ncbi:DUF4861 family protein [Sphingobacterium kyonggiense]